MRKKFDYSLVRIFVDENLEQNKLACDCVAKAKQVYVPMIVQVELVWVLKNAYELKKEEIVAVLSELESNAAFQLEHSDRFSTALAVFRKYSVDFSEALIFAGAREEGLSVVTFDKKFSVLSHVKKLEAD